MTSMIERVAAVIAMKCEGWTKNAKDYIPHARAAIEAMREPTDAMVDALEGYDSTPVSLYERAIDAALLEQQP